MQSKHLLLELRHLDRDQLKIYFCSICKEKVVFFR